MILSIDPLDPVSAPVPPDAVSPRVPPDPVSSRVAAEPPGAGALARDLFPDGGEFVQAVRGFVAHGPSLPIQPLAVPRGAIPALAIPRLAIPDAVFLELYAYEFLERAREFAADADGTADSGPAGSGLPAGVTWRIPFWPESALAAAGITVHAARELEGMLPEFTSVVVRERPVEVIAAAAVRVLGEVRFDPESYAADLRARARTRGWEVQA